MLGCCCFLGGFFVPPERLVWQIFVFIDLDDIEGETVWSSEKRIPQEEISWTLHSNTLNGPGTLSSWVSSSSSGLFFYQILAAVKRGSCFIFVLVWGGFFIVTSPGSYIWLWNQFNQSDHCLWPGNLGVLAICVRWPFAIIASFLIFHCLITVYGGQIVSIQNKPWSLSKATTKSKILRQ